MREHHRRIPQNLNSSNQMSLKGWTPEETHDMCLCTGGPGGCSPVAAVPLCVSVCWRQSLWASPLVWGCHTQDGPGHCWHGCQPALISDLKRQNQLPSGPVSTRISFTFSITITASRGSALCPYVQATLVLFKISAWTPNRRSIERTGRWVLIKYNTRQQLQCLC